MRLYTYVYMVYNQKPAIIAIHRKLFIREMNLKCFERIKQYAV